MEIHIAAIVALIMSIVLHEMAHGYAANSLGDPTARLQGRLSPNPLVHIDPLGSVIIPALLMLAPGVNFILGWAKPVPYNPYNLSNQKWGEAIVAAAGPAVNLFIAFVFGCLIRFSDILALNGEFLELASFIVFINILLALFNLIPFPPLDGSKILPALLPYSLQVSYQSSVRMLESYGFLVLIVLLFILIQFVWPFLFHGIASLGGLFTGLSPMDFLRLLPNL